MRFAGVPLFGRRKAPARHHGTLSSNISKDSSRVCSLLILKNKYGQSFAKSRTPIIYYQVYITYISLYQLTYPALTDEACCLFLHIVCKDYVSLRRACLVCKAYVSLRRACLIVIMGIRDRCPANYEQLARKYEKWSRRGGDHRRIHFVNSASSQRSIVAH